MEVILLDAVERLGKRGDVVKVADGYARNYLIPRRLAVPATPSNLRAFQAEEKLLQRKREKEKRKAEKLANKISKLSLKIEVRTGEDDKLYGAVSSVDILQALKEKGVELEKHMIKMEEPIRELGVYRVPIKLHPQVETTVKVEVIKKE